MPDDVDRAGDREQELRDDAWSDWLAKRERDQSTLTSGPAPEYCYDCGESIPAARREAAPGCLRCVDCQRLHERGGA